jgi:hypothetical protein
VLKEKSKTAKLNWSFTGLEVPGIPLTECRNHNDVKKNLQYIASACVCRHNVASATSTIKQSSVSMCSLVVSVIFDVF